VTSNLEVGRGVTFSSRENSLGTASINHAEVRHRKWTGISVSCWFPLFVRVVV